MRTKAIPSISDYSQWLTFEDVLICIYDEMAQVCVLGFVPLPMINLNVVTITYVARYDTGVATGSGNSNVTLKPIIEINGEVTISCVKIIHSATNDVSDSSPCLDG